MLPCCFDEHNRNGSQHSVPLHANWTSAHSGITCFCLLRLSLSETSPCDMRKAPICVSLRFGLFRACRLRILHRRMVIFVSCTSNTSSSECHLSAKSEIHACNQYDFEFDVQHVSFLFFLRAARHPVDSDGRPTAGAQVLARVRKLPWHPYHSGPALHCRVPSRSERCLLS